MSVGVRIGNLIQSALTDLHMVSNAEKLVNQGYISTIGDQNTRRWSALMANFTKNIDTDFVDNRSVDADGVIQLNNFSLFSSKDCAVRTFEDLTESS